MAKFIKVKAKDEMLDIKEVAGRWGKRFPRLSYSRVRRVDQELRKTDGALRIGDLYSQWRDLARETIGHLDVTPDNVSKGDYARKVILMLKDLTRKYDLDDKIMVDGLGETLTFDDMYEEEAEDSYRGMDKKALDRDWDDMEEVYDWLVDNAYFTEGELRLITDINGWNMETINDAIYSRHGYQSIRQFAESEGEVIDQDLDLPLEVYIDLDVLVDFPEDYDEDELSDAISRVLAEDYPDARGADTFDYRVEDDEVHVYNIEWDV